MENSATTDSHLTGTPGFLLRPLLIKVNSLLRKYLNPVSFLQKDLTWFSVTLY